MMNLAKQFREFGVLNSINPLPPDAQVLWYNLMQCFNTARWSSRKLVVRTQTLENICGMTRKKLAVSRNTLIQRGLIHYYPARQASGSPSYEINYLYENDVSVFPTETQEGTHRGTQEGTQNGTQVEHLIKTKLKETKLNSSGDEAPAKEKKLKVNSERIYWKTIVSTWDIFYQKNKGENYSYLEKDFSALKKIYDFLKQRSKEKKWEWSEINAVDGFNWFLNAAWAKDNWLKNNFSLTNLLSQFNIIANGKQSDSNNKQPTGGAVNTGSILSKIASMPDAAGNTG